MNNRVFFSRSSLLFSILLCALHLKPAVSVAQIISPNGTEVTFSYTASFEIPAAAAENTDEKRIKLHASHVFGIFQSPTFVSQMGLDPKVSAGIGAPQAQMKLTVVSSEQVADKIKITYTAAGKMILHQDVARNLLKVGYLDLPLPTNPYAIYDVSCTDDHYTLFSDFWYFYDPFREGCKHLSAEPMAKLTRFKIAPVTVKKMDLTPKLPYLRGDNDNGDLFSIYIIHGYAEKNVADDEGRVSFKALNKHLLNNGFTETREHQSKVIPMYIYRKEIRLDNGKKIKVQIKHLLVETSINSRSKTFATFFKEAVISADVIYYGGHSGLGGTLDIPSLEEKVGPLTFNTKKKQIFFFESCASYSYYLKHFAKEKTKAKIDIVTNGLASYFHTSHVVLTTFLGHLLSANSKDVPWSLILGDMESALEGTTYLTSVGGI